MLSPYYCSDCSIADTVHFSQLLCSPSGILPVPNGNNLWLCKFVQWMLAPFRSRHSSLVPTVQYVFLMSSQEKMIGVAANSVVAFVAHLLSFWNWSIGENPRKFGRRYFSSKHSESTVPATTNSSPPRPTLVHGLHFHLGPKSLLDYFGSFVFFASERPCLSRCLTQLDIFGRVFLHRSVRLICAALRDRQVAGAFLFSANSIPSQPI